MSINRFKIFLNLFLIIAISCMLFFPAYSNDLSIVEKKRKEAHAQVKKLGILESLETNKLYKNQLKLEKNQNALSSTKRQYAKKQSQLHDLEIDLENAQEDFYNSRTTTKSHLRNIYKNRNTSIVSIFLSTKDFNDFLDMIYYQNIITKSDAKKLKVLKEKSNRISALKKQVESEKKAISSLISTMNKQNNSIQYEISKNKNMISKIQTNKRAYERAEREFARQSENLNAMISRNTSKSTVKVTTGFLRPVSGPITSPFGSRIHPIFKSKTYHSGIDIGAAYGTPIKASNSGKVIYSGWYGGYGKVVIIDHGTYNGSPTTTLYAHMSSQKVYVGQNVTKGQVIGLVGSTGYSTGPHLHFEVRINGKPNNPLNYV